MGDFLILVPVNPGRYRCSGYEKCQWPIGKWVTKRIRKVGNSKPMGSIVNDNSYLCIKISNRHRLPSDYFTGNIDVSSNYRSS